MANFTVIKGGRDYNPALAGRKYLTGSITATRLMGVIGMELIWEITSENNKKEHMHQIFYLDAEEYGFESFIQAMGQAPEEIVRERARLIGSLGGGMTRITEKEARFILQTYVSISKKYGEPLPEGRERYSYMLEPVQTLTKQEYLILMTKACGPIETPYYAINYFMMRTVSCDDRGVAYLAGKTEDFPEEITPETVAVKMPFAIFGHKTPSTLCRNSIEAAEGRPGVYMCESLIEISNSYRILTSEITVTTSSPFRILDAHRLSDFKISSAEASMLMDRSEFVTVFDIPNVSDEFLDKFREYVDRLTETQYENGTLYIDFKNNNSHAGLAEYRINDDIHVMYFLTLTNQILLIGYSEDALREAEILLNLEFSDFPVYLSMKYEFKDPIIYEFMQSDFDDFESFIEYLSGEPDN